MAGSLSHVRVLDLSRILAGPWASQILGDLGAEVIKIERPLVGDDTRTWAPPYVKDAHGEPTRESAYFMCTNRNKKSVAVDFTRPEGQALIRELVKVSDVLIENFKVGGLKQYGLDYESLRALNPGLVYCSVTGFGQTGPYAERPGYDFLIQGMGGLMSVTGRKDDEAGAGPLKVGVALTDVMTGLYASTSVLAALAHKERTGEGQHIDLSLLDVGVATMANQAANYLHTGHSPRRMGNGHPNVVPYQDFPTADGDMILAVGNDGQFQRLCEALGAPELGTDERYTTNALRVANRDTLIPRLRQLTVQRPTDEWITLLEAANVPCGPINNLERVFQNPQVQSRRLKIEMEHALAGSLPMVASPIRMSKTPVEYRLAPPLLGEHTREVLRDVLAVDDAQLIALARDQVI